MVYIRDVAHVRDGNPPQTNIVHVDGNRSVLMQVLKNGSVSTLAIIDGIKEKAGADQGRSLPANLKIALIGDQSMFVSGAVSGVIREGVIAAALTSLMILIFLGSWRSTVIIATSIPLSVLGSIATLCGARRDAQHHDARRPCARRRHPRRRRDGDDREHQLASRAGQGGRDRDHGRRRADRDAGFRLAAVHLHRVRADVLPAGRGALPVRADGRSGDVGDGLLVHPVAHAGADDGELSAAQARAAHRHARPRRSAAAVAQSAGALPARLRSAASSASGLAIASF